MRVMKKEKKMATFKGEEKKKKRKFLEKKRKKKEKKGLESYQWFNQSMGGCHG